jgi:hypothetical protein
MVIYTNNLAEKLFGFAISRDQLRTTGLCDILEDPNLQLDIDLAIDFNAAIRGDEDAAERFTNTLILSSALLDYSTADFYTTRMEQYPIFEYHIDRVTYIFESLDNINDYYAAASARDKNFIDSLKSALKDCLNSPCNLFAASSESIAASIDYVAASNSTTIPPFAELKDLVRTTYGGLKNTLVKQLPDAVSNMIGKVAILGQDAFNQSIDIMFEKDKEKKDKIIANALAGKALDYDTTGYTYVPDIESFTSIEGFATSVLSQAASDLGGCFRKYQHLARYSPFDPDQNLSRTGTEPVQDSVDGQGYRRNSGGVVPPGLSRENALSCDYELADPDVAPPGASSTTRNEQLLRVMRYLKGSRFDPDANGGNFIIPKDGEIYGIKNGTLDEWANFFVNLADVESTFRPGTYADINGFPPANIDNATSFGLYQLGLPQFSRFSGININRASANNAWADPDKNTQAFIKYAEELYFGGGVYGSKGGIDRIATKSNEGISAGFGPLRNIAKGKPTKNQTKLIVNRAEYQKSL